MDPGSPLRVVATKWGDRPHWEHDAVWLGQDEHGTWAGVRVGTVITRPGARVVTRQPQVELFPAAPYVATFYADEADPPCRVYVDISTVPLVADRRVRSVDLDLDVLVGVHGRVWVDDEDEFAEHRALWGYPDEIVAMAVTSCEAVRDAAAAGLAPFDGAHLAWLERLAAT
jgi:protein associated with RNAse G/E